MNLSHFTTEPFTLDAGQRYTQGERPLKPSGLWLSDESDHGWSTWCRESEFGLDRLAWRTELRVKRGSNVLALTSLSEILEFTRQYAAPADWRPTSLPLPGDERPGMFNVKQGYVDWEQVAGRWDGILVTPYDWNARMHRDTLWYYGWDCASGCFWNLDAIEQVGESVPVPEDERSSTAEHYSYEDDDVDA